MATSEALTQISTQLASKLSSEAKIYKPTNAEEFEKTFDTWSNYNLKMPSAVVMVACEQDVIETVKYATANSIPFKARCGGHSNTNSIGEGGIIIDLSQWKVVSYDSETQTLKVQGGAVVQDGLNAAYNAGRCVVLGTCNTVGMIPLTLGGGLSPLQTIHGMATDNLVSARVVTSTAELVIASATENPDLFWGLRGAGQMLGFVTEVVFKTYPLSSLGSDDGTIWSGKMAFGLEKVAEVTRVVSEMVWKDMSCIMICAAMPPEFQPALNVYLTFFGSDSGAANACTRLSALSPVVMQSSRVPFNRINGNEDPFTVKGGFKTMYGAGLQILDPVSVEKAFMMWKDLVTQHPAEAGNSIILIEAFGMDKVREIGDMDTAFAHRNVNYWVGPSPYYSSSDLHATAEAWGRSAKAALREGDTGKPAMYSNYGYEEGEAIEPIENVFGDGERMAKLRDLKKKWDPTGVFGKIFL